MPDTPETAIAQALEQVGPRLKRVRSQRGATLSEVSAATGISTSTLSRLESGQRRPSLELLLPLAQTYRVPLDELVGAPEIGDPRVRFTPRNRNGRVVVPLTRQPGGLQAWKVVISPERGEPELRTHEGFEWLFVLAGRLRLLLADRDLVLGPGEVAEFDPRHAHGFGPADDRPVELLSLLGKQGERIHVRASPRSKADPG